MKRLLFIISIGVVLSLVFRYFCFEVIYIATSSMEPACKVGENVLINKMAYLFKKPERGDIVLIQSPVSDKGLVKRVVGLPGETISIENKQVYIDDFLLEEDYVQFTRPDTMLVGDNIDSWIIPYGHYFVMGDNRDVSRDSRDWLEEYGLQTEAIPISSINGKRLVLY